MKAVKIAKDKSQKNEGSGDALARLRAGYHLGGEPLTRNAAHFEENSGMGILPMCQKPPLRN